MQDWSIWQWLAIAALVMCALTPLIAYRKNRSPVDWFVLGLLFNPVAFVALLFLPARPRPPYRPPAAGSANRIIE